MFRHLLSKFPALKITWLAALFIFSHIVATFWLSTLSTAEDYRYRFALVPKTIGNAFFIPSGEGCKDAAETLKSVTCIFVGPETFDFRLQNDIINDLIDDGIDGIAVSITHSKFLADNSIRRAIAAGIPVLTYDSDFGPEELAETPNLRQTYIGTDNFGMGLALGERLRDLKPKGGSLCIISGRAETPNLQQRVRGLRAALLDKQIDQDTVSLNTRIPDAGQWHEHRRCPLYSQERPQTSLLQMETMLEAVGKEADAATALVVVGLWPQLNSSFDTVMAQFQQQMDNQEIIVLLADTMPFQLPHIKAGLSHGNIGQRPYAMGYKAMETLYAIVKKQPVDDIIYTPLTDCRKDNTDSCTH